MLSDRKLLSYFKQYLPTANGRYTLTNIAASRIVAGIMVASLLLPFPWFTLSDSGKSIAGTRLLGYAFDGFSFTFLFSISPVHTLLLFSLPMAITILALMTLADAILNDARNARTISVLNIIAILMLMYAATIAADPARHSVIGGVLILPKWGLWLTFLLAVGLVMLPMVRTTPNLGDLNYKRLVRRLQRTERQHPPT